MWATTKGPTGGMKVDFLATAHLRPRTSRNSSQCRTVLSLSEECENCSTGNNIFIHERERRFRVPRFQNCEKSFIVQEKANKSHGMIWIQVAFFGTRMMRSRFISGIDYMFLALGIPGARGFLKKFERNKSLWIDSVSINLHFSWMYKKKQPHPQCCRLIQMEHMLVEMIDVD
jgi:hypothetical protein